MSDLVSASAGALVLLGDVPGGVHPAVRVQHSSLDTAIGLEHQILTFSFLEKLQ